MLQGCYTFNELKEKYNWNTSEGTIQKQIIYARNRGVEIEKAFKQGKTYFRIVSDSITELNDGWQTFPTNPRYEVHKSGKVRTKEDKKIVGSISTGGYVIVTDQTQTPTQYYRVHRMVMETFNPIPNSENFIVDHINGIKTDNRLENLRWLTQRQNTQFRDENYAKLNQNYQKLIEKYGYEGLNNLFLAILNEKE